MMNPTMGDLDDVRTLIAGLGWHVVNEPDANVSLNPMERDAILMALRQTLTESHQQFSSEPKP